MSLLEGKICCYLLILMHLRQSTLMEPLVAESTFVTLWLPGLSVPATLDSLDLCAKSTKMNATATRA